MFRILNMMCSSHQQQSPTPFLRCQKYQIVLLSSRDSQCCLQDLNLLVSQDLPDQVKEVSWSCSASEILRSSSSQILVIPFQEERIISSHVKSKQKLLHYVEKPTLKIVYKYATHFQLEAFYCNWFHLHTSLFYYLISQGASRNI